MTDTNESSDSERACLASGARTMGEVGIAERAFAAGRTFERSQQAERSPHPVMTSATGEDLVSWVAAHGGVVLDALDLYRWQVVGTVTAHHNIFQPDRVLLECGHEAESWGGLMARCVECKKQPGDGSKGTK